jgi:hypothetical protein
VKRRWPLLLPAAAAAAVGVVYLCPSHVESSRIGIRRRRRQQQVVVEDQVREVVKLTTVSWVVVMTLVFDFLAHVRHYSHHLFPRVFLGRACKEEEKVEESAEEVEDHSLQQLVS